MTSPVLVAGGIGRLGRPVIPRLRDAGREVRVLARHDRGTPSDVTFVTGDLRKGGEGVDLAVHGVDTIIHCATANRGDAEATGNLLSAASRAGRPHVVYVHPRASGSDRSTPTRWRPGSSS